MSEVKPPTSASLRAAEEWLAERPRNSRDAAGLAAMVDGVRRAALGQAAEIADGVAAQYHMSVPAVAVREVAAAIRALMEGE